MISHTAWAVTAVAAVAAAAACPAMAAVTVARAAAVMPRAPGSGRRRSPYSWMRPITLVRARSLTWASAGRCTIAQNTSVP
jgi:hypothetical protein